MAIKKPQVSEDTQGKVAYKLHVWNSPDFSGKKVFLRGLLVTSDRSRFRITTGQLIHQLNSAYQVLDPQYPSASRPLDFW